MVSSTKYLKAISLPLKSLALKLDQVLVVGGDDLKVGDPTVAGATVEASVVKEGRAKKVIVYKYKRKTGYHKKNGHRQAFTQVKIEKING